ncbi:DMT family transporter [Endozoicomonas sp.]|uniref:DMT family transporter n=1 Tax=Endozoicomonas sp. TaxID=1892382 RepID=UPI003AF6820D
MKYALRNINTSSQSSIAVLLSALLWGTTGAAASFISDVNPMAVGAFSMGIGGILLALTARKKLIEECLLLSHSWRIVLIGSLSLTVYPQAFYSSMHFAGVAVGNVISIASAPFMTVIIERLLLNKKQITFRWLFSAVLGTAGIVLLTLSEDYSTQAITEDSSRQIGVLLGLLAALTYAGYTCAAKKLMEQGAHSTSAMGSIFCCASLFLLPTLLFTGEHLFSSIENTVAVWYLALVPMFLGYLCFGFGLRFIPASKATLLTLFEPVVAVCLAVIIVKEVIAPTGWLGMGLIMVCLIIQASEKDETRKGLIKEYSKAG